MDPVCSMIMPTRKFIQIIGSRASLSADYVLSRSMWLDAHLM